MYKLFHEMACRPAPFSRYTARQLWTKPHLARQMLDYHLSQESDLASRRLQEIDRIADWIDRELGLQGRALCDLGCGPGLYADRFAVRGAAVTGVDFSAVALNYARANSDPSIRYLEADYLSDPLPGGFDLVTLIYTDYAVLSPAQRGQLLAKIATMQPPGGQLLMDVNSLAGFNQRQESLVIQQRLMDGFWAAGEYIGLQRTLLYPDERVSLDHYLIVEPDQHWQIYNWFQYFTVEEVSDELAAAGYRVEGVFGDLGGAPLEPDSELIGLVATRE